MQFKPGDSVWATWGKIGWRRAVVTMVTPSSIRIAWNFTGENNRATRTYDQLRPHVAASIVPPPPRTPDTPNRKGAA